MYNLDVLTNSNRFGYVVFGLCYREAYREEDRLSGLSGLVWLQSWSQAAIMTSGRSAIMTSGRGNRRLEHVAWPDNSLQAKSKHAHGCLVGSYSLARHKFGSHTSQGPCFVGFLSSTATTFYVVLTPKVLASIFDTTCCVGNDDQKLNNPFGFFFCRA